MLLHIMTKNKDWPITVRLEEDEWNYVNKLASSEDRSLSGVARYLLKWGIDQHKKAGKLVYKDESSSDPKAKALRSEGKKERAG